MQSTFVQESSVNHSTEYTTENEEFDIEKYFTYVRENSSDFDSWTYLLHYLEQNTVPIATIREIFDHFLSKFPYCFGYWKKYADFEGIHSNPKRVEAVYERGVAAISLSVDLWLFYIDYIRERKANGDDDGGGVVGEDGQEVAAVDAAAGAGGGGQGQDRLVKLFERAIESAGRDFQADRIWTQFIEYVRQQGLEGFLERGRTVAKLFEIYRQLISIPISQHSQHWEAFKTFIMQNDPKVMLAQEQYLAVRAEAKKRETDPAKANGAKTVNGQVTEGENTELSRIRQVIVDYQQEVYRKTETEVLKRSHFENNIKRSYFHVTPLDKAQLKNWKGYLDFEIENGTRTSVVVLFERCCIACALYEDIWLKYAMYMQLHDVEATRAVYKRACTIHLPLKADLHLAWALFEENQGQNEAAWAILNQLEQALPDMPLISMRRIGFYRRQGKPDDVVGLFEHYVQHAVSKEARNFFAAKYARYLYKISNNFEKGKQVLLDAIRNDPKCYTLYLQLLDLHYQEYPRNVKDKQVFELFDRIMASELSLDEKVEFSRRRVEFLEDFGIEATKLNEYYEKHQLLVRQYQRERKQKAIQIDIEKELEAKRMKKMARKGVPAAASYPYPAMPANPADQNTTATQGFYGSTDWNYASYGQTQYGYQYGSYGYNNVPTT